MLKVYALWNLSNLTYIIFWEIYTIYSPHIPTFPRSILSILPSCPPNFWIFLFFFLKSFLRLGVLPNYSWAWGLYWSVVGRPGVMPLKKADFLLSQLLWDTDNSLASIGTFCQSPSTMLVFCTSFVRSVSFTVGSYVRLPCGTQKMVFPWSHLPPLAFTNLSASSSMKIPEPWSKGCGTHVSVRSEHSSDECFSVSDPQGC